MDAHLAAGGEGSQRLARRPDHGEDSRRRRAALGPDPHADDKNEEERCDQDRDEYRFPGNADDAQKRIGSDEQHGAEDQTEDSSDAEQTEARSVYFRKEQDDREDEQSDPRLS